MSGISALRGIIPPLATPLTDSREIDRAGMGRLVRYVLDGGVSGVFVMGSTGEFAAFSREQRRSIIAMVVEEVAGRVPVLAGVSDSGSDLAARNARDAESVGADAVIATLPYYYPSYSETSAEDHFHLIAASTRLPVLIYQIPQLAKSAVGVETIETLARDGTVAGVKDSSADFAGLEQLVFRLCDLPDFRLFQGNEFELAGAVLMGAHGGITGIANLAPHLCVQLYEAARDGRIEEARGLQRRVSELGRLFYVGESPIGSLKAALSVVGICGCATARPIPGASEESLRVIRRIIEEHGPAGVG